MGDRRKRAYRSHIVKLTEAGTGTVTGTAFRPVVGTVIGAICSPGSKVPLSFQSNQPWITAGAPVGFIAVTGMVKLPPGGKGTLGAKPTPSSSSAEPVFNASSPVPFAFGAPSRSPSTDAPILKFGTTTCTGPTCSIVVL